MIAIAVGKAGMAVKEVYSLEVDELSEILRAWSEKEDAEYRDRWERTRFLALTALLPYQKKGKRLKPTDIAKFPWDNPHGKTTSEDLERIRTMFGED
ncbi:MAG TPA: hypothetical protein DDZ04_04360 [Parabacteroides sp.]|nr:hypothetical protein [Parabacteroides sp.]